MKRRTSRVQFKPVVAFDGACLKLRRVGKGPKRRWVCDDARLQRQKSPRHTTKKRS